MNFIPNALPAIVTTEDKDKERGENHAAFSCVVMLSSIPHSAAFISSPREQLLLQGLEDTLSMETPHLDDWFSKR